MPELRPILEQFAEALKADVIKVSKRFAPSIESVVTDDSIAILGSPFISVLIDGRKPTSPNAPKGNPTLQEIILSWIQEKGLQAYADKNGKIPSQLSLSWAISQSIHRNGDRLYQAGGGNNIFETIITKSRLDSFVKSISSSYAESFTSDLKLDL